MQEKMNRRSAMGLLLGSTIAAGTLTTVSHTASANKTEPKVLPGAEPFYYKGNDIGILVLHGFTGTTQSMRYYGEQLNKKFGFTVSGPRLAGHGTSPEDMATTGYLDWVGSAEKALKDLSEKTKKVYVTGLSMGGCITLNLAARHPKIVKGIVPINSVAGFVSEGLLGLMMLNPAPKMIKGLGSDIKAKGVEELAYKQIPVSCLREVFTLQAVTSNLLPNISCPAFVMQSREDHVVKPKNAKHIVSNVSSSIIRKLTLENSFHVATLDNDKDLIIEKAGNFFNEISKLP